MISSTRLWALAGAGAVFAGSLAMGPALRADTGTITLVRNDSTIDGVTGDIGGGEFCVTQFSGFGLGSLAPQGANVKVGNCIFETFCLEGNEFLPSATQLNWSNSGAAHAGGNAASPGGPPSIGSDPLSPETAYLFARFWNGTLSTYDYLPLGGTIPGANRRTSANDLQMAIWYLEDELLGSNVSGPGGHLGWNYLSARAQGWVSDAFVQTAPGGTWSTTWGAGSIGNVTVLTLTYLNGDPAQDVLALDPVAPPPQTGGGGLTPGWWQNKNGQKLIGSDDLKLLKDLCLVNEDGTAFCPKAACDVGKWILAKADDNMAYKLSSMLASMELNVFNGFVNAGALVYCPTSVDASGKISISALMTLANNELCAHPLTPVGNAYRSWQETLKNVLDDANNNKNWVP